MGYVKRNGCNGQLIKFDPDEVLINNYYRNKYMTMKIEPLSVREHTAQLSKNIAKKYQNDFKDGKINVLSCSTTFEMGVDIGSLETVFMRNVPPSPANYAQRAGRAGRRKESDAFIITFCSNSSHDYTYFQEPFKMITGLVTPPKFSVTNEKIILRHLLAASLGWYFKLNPELFKNVGLFVDGGIEDFRRYIESKPQDLNDYINEKILDDTIREKYKNFKWYQIMKETKDLLSLYEKKVTDTIASFEKAITIAIENEEYDYADYCKKQIESVKAEYLINDLSLNGVIPKYGFPVDTVELTIKSERALKYRGSKSANKNISNLSRDLKIALSEYAPESEIMVDKKKYMSRYIVLPKNGRHRQNYYYRCDECERINIGITHDELDKCKYCGSKNKYNSDMKPYFIEPIYGFITGELKQTTRKKPEKTFATEVEYIGDKDVVENTYSLNENVKIETSTDDKLLVMNDNNFYMCELCGYTMLKKKGEYGASTYVLEHANQYDRKCENKELKRLQLGHTFKTDVTKIMIANLTDVEIAYSTLYALLEGISIAFNIERRDINGLIQKNYFGEYDLILFDDVPGGAGHIKRLNNENDLKIAIESAKRKVAQDCCDEETACYNCLRNYSNQKKHKYLSREKAKIGLEMMCQDN